LHYLDGKLSRKEAIQIVSVKLRELAKKQNVFIDDVYRNVNGITFQMHSMESAYKGYTVVKPASNYLLKLLNY
jgi:tRNA A37 N6-isopentenylltransferase MiaA